MIPVAPSVQNSDNEVLYSFEVTEQNRLSEWIDDNNPVKYRIVDDSKDQVTCSLANNTSLTFPWQLHSLLEAAERERFHHIVSWQDDKAFKIHNRPLFVKHIMPRCFKRQSKYKSFQRQLNLWQFQRLNRSRGSCHSGGYFHPYFHRHNTSLFNCMKRSIKQKSEGPRGYHDLVDIFHEEASLGLKAAKEGINCRTMTTTELEVRDVNSSYIYDASLQNRVDVENRGLLDSDIMSTPYDKATSGYCTDPGFGQDFVMGFFDFKPQPPTNFSRDAHVATDWVQPESDLPWSVKHDYMDGDEITLPLHKCSSKKGMTEMGSPLPALSAAEWKYVLVGIEMAMT